MRKGKIIVVSMMVFCVLVFFIAIAWFVLYQGEMTEPSGEDKHAAIVHAAGLLKTELKDKQSIEKMYQRSIIARKVNLDSGEFVTDNRVGEGCKTLSPEHDPAQIRQRCPLADIYFAKDKNDKIQSIIIPVSGKGAKSMMHAFLALGLDGRTVKNLYYYQQRETPFLGARVEDENWRKQWPGKILLDNNGKPSLKIVQGKSADPDENTIDGISGATLTSIGVEKSINYWMGEQGYGHFLQRLAHDPNILNASTLISP
ncbi:NADH:ubiquinone reductase (Na(+)-transporting) subunit C [Citrobacter amalonaticus]|uniref:Na(+)-translocating NADH-quinone reductase subunit C n=1 Tax=Citrobacter amalonaticus TaxID=35703 RepID=A0A2S4RYE7_CITAM|nr:NADH:ubiquinone reductase (Na(+)-transporting) subunit C [Citrobacter amalonaticus]POT57804.1 NADH:ubiquinone reductase (Na(+)-transporting) subunit C [Citrobacter amalonaticus]POT76669.1 NADH:ubiquinone reductase (Na(+)-transporting) subunit C [Citrobacter amalonaticus]POU65748.1 NADH:ubiquinone reductase (Na(+)-transporting) subunit C [Citrobacter amalonaticus]POV05905.1 NADH:ubiquinone reductase (Na(+)-transporting) subunit C [Citrobacter amalonaticus]